MNDPTSQLGRRYRIALERHLNDGQARTLRPALTLGKLALALGLDILELAEIHHASLNHLASQQRRPTWKRRSSLFFNEALISIAETHRAARVGRTELVRLNSTLNQRTAELARMNQQLVRGIDRRKKVEAALRKSNQHYGALLKGSVQLQRGLRQLTHRVMAAQEDERITTSQKLQNDVAQTLLGINVHLLNLKQTAKGNTKDLKAEISNTQTLVTRSERSVRRVAQGILKA